MKSFTALLIALVAMVDQTAAFSGSSFTGARVNNAVQNAGTCTISMEYIPSGLSKEQWKKMKEAEKNKNKGKNLGKTGITSFKSRSFADWQKSGGKNLFPVDPTKVKDAKEIPYMQRPGGKADDSDLKNGGKGGGFSFFGGGDKKKKEEPEPEPEKKKNWWTL